MGADQPLSVCLFGVPGSSHNLGVGALRRAAACGVLRRVPSALVTVYDDGWGVRTEPLVVDGVERTVQLCGARRSRRWHRRESYLNMRISGAFGGAGNRGLEIMSSADAILDVSGGDSFSDLYGAHRYWTVAWPKRLALHRGRPLILLPQTYGPFKSNRLKSSAAEFVRRADMAWARDTDSFAALQELLGSDFDSRRHRLGVDMAFAMRGVKPDTLDLPEWFFHREGSPVVGVNVSGLLALDSHADHRYGLRARYIPLVRELITRLVNDGASVLLVPHVIRDAREGDDIAQERLLADLPKSMRARVACSPPTLGPGETKWLISQLDWFCGTRMHSAIAGLSSGVPTAAVAYSYKTRGVFETCRMRDQVVDARKTDTTTAVDQLFELYQRRAATRAALVRAREEITLRAEAQFDEIVEAAGSRRLELA